MLDKIITATFKMHKGDIVFRLLEESPIHTNAFINNAESGKFKGVNFYRLVNNWIAQTSPTEASGPMWDELKPPRRAKDNNIHFFGVLSSANSGTEHTSVGAFFICLGRWRGKDLDKNYTTFGHILSGWEHIEKIEKGDILNDVIINTYTLN
jgi:cyclophilin family peptidyl-prolyl cis-trans isomerase